MARLACCVLFAVTPLLVAACGGGKQPPKDPDSEPAIDEVNQPDLGGEPGDEPGDDTPSKAAPITTTGAAPPIGSPNEYEITQHDCNLLSKKYEDLLRKDEMAKLDKKGFKPKMYEQAKKQIDKIVQEGYDNYRQQCDGIVGTVQVRSRLKCSLDAKELERFNGCADGKFDDEAPE